jgi:Tol biopolymer transport system component
MRQHAWAVFLFMFCLLAGCGPEGYTRIDPGGEYVYANPVWSPDSRQIAYTRCEIYDTEKGRKGPSCELFIMNAATRDAKQLTYNDFNDGQPAWSADGWQIVYRREQTDGSSLRVIEADGSNDIEIFACPRRCSTPAWSPTNDVIAFQMVTSSTVETASTAPSNLYLIRSDGGDLRQLTQGTQPVWRPRWSPDGKQIVFRRAADQPIRVIDVTTSQETAYAVQDVRGPDEPIFTPDGANIVFSAYGSAKGKRLYRLNRADGSIGLLLNAVDDYPPDMKSLIVIRRQDDRVSAFYEKLYTADVEHTLVK